MSRKQREFILDSNEDVTVVVEMGNITPKQIWETKDEWHAFVQASKETWEKMTTEQQEAVERVVRNGMERLYDKLQEWIPEGLEVQSGNYLDVHFKILFTDIDKDIARNDQATTFKIKAAVEGTQNLLADLAVKPQEEQED